jgi:environmental stress-induced protein Ves
MRGSALIVELTPSQYGRLPWKNGGGVTVDIAWQGDLWRFGRTPIVAAGPFSDYGGFDRCQVLVAGRGLVLDTPEGEIDVRVPFKPVRFAGETRIVTRLEAGPVEVVNLIGDRAAVRVDLRVLDAGGQAEMAPGIHLAYCPTGTADLVCEGNNYALVSDHSLRIEPASRTILSCTRGRILAASIIPVRGELSCG